MFTKSFVYVRMLITLLFVISLVAACGSTPATPPAPPAETTEDPTAPATEEMTATPAASEGDAAADADTPQPTSDSRFLIFGAAGEPDNINAMATMSIASLIVTKQIEETLVGLVPGTLDLRPELATEWQANEDSTEWTFKLREGVMFHDDTPLNAEAVVFNFERMAEPDFPYGFREEGTTYPMFPNIFGGFADEPDTLWESVEAVDDMTVRFTLKKPTPLFPNYVAATSLAISSPDAIKTHGADYGTPDVGSVGTGPFRFLDWQPRQSITLVRNDNYWGTPAEMPGVTIRFIEDQAQRLAELQAGTVDFAINLSPDARDMVEQDPTLEPISPAAFNTGYLSINVRNTPLDDPRVRQAIAHAIDKEAILNSFYHGIGSVASDMLPEGLAWARPPDLDPYPYDPERARELLTEAGFPHGISRMTLMDGTEGPIELWYMPVARTYYPAPKAIAETFATYLADVDIEVELKTEDWESYLSNWNAGNKNGLVMLGWLGDYNDPNNFLLSLFGPGVVQESGYRNDELNQLLTEAATAPTREEATELFHAAGRLINHDVPRLPIVHAPPLYVHRVNIAGWQPSPTGMESFAPIIRSDDR